MRESVILSTTIRGGQNYMHYSGVWLLDSNKWWLRVIEGSNLGPEQLVEESGSDDHLNGGHLSIRKHGSRWRLTIPWEMTSIDLHIPPICVINSIIDYYFILKTHAVSTIQPLPHSTNRSGLSWIRMVQFPCWDPQSNVCRRQIHQGMVPGQTL